MAIYPVLLIAGFFGLLALAAIGFVHGPHAGVRGGQPGHGGAHGPAGHAHGPSGHAPTGAAHGVGGRGPVGGKAAAGSRASAPSSGARSGSTSGDQQSTVAVPPGDFVNGLMRLLPLVSPLNWFSWFVGAGAAGTLCMLAGVKEPLRAGIAVAGAVAFNMAVLKPLWTLIFGFASKPAANLEGCLLQEVEAVTAFNTRGEGLIRVIVDGRSEDVLARLTPEARARGERVRRGDQLLVEDVDPHTNRCTVSRTEVI